MNAVKPSQILGGAMGWLDEIGFETEAPSVSSVAKGVGGIFQDIFSLVSEDVAGVKKEENNIPKAYMDAFKNEPEYKLDPTKPCTGTIEFQKKVQEDQKQKEVAANQRIFFQALKEDQQRAKEAKDKMLLEEEINDIISTLPTAQKNELLHYQASYKDKSIYQMAELRKKLIEQRKKSEAQQKQASIPSPAKQPSAMEGAFEGRSGSQGGGTANLSAQAVG